MTRSSRRISGPESFEDMCTLLGGLNQDTCTGYAGQWQTWEVPPGSDSPQLIDSSINIRLWRLLDPNTHDVEQSNLYQAPDKMADPSTRFAPYLRGNTMSGRPDGYGLRVWTFNPSSDLVSSDAGPWAEPGVGERSMRVLSVAGRGATIINGALPSGFEAGHVPPFWVLEFIIRDPGDTVRRWASMSWYEAGQLVVCRAINEDHLSLPPDLEQRFIDPLSIRFSERREGTIDDIDAYYRSKVGGCGALTSFTYDSEQQLVVSQGSCSWGEVVAGPGTLLQQGYPDWSYCRVPRDLPAALELGPHLTFEAGTVLRDGSIARWLLTYDTSGTRTLAEARFETYPPGGGAD